MDATFDSRCTEDPHNCFNPHPPSRMDATWGTGTTVMSSRVFQSPSTLTDGCDGRQCRPLGRPLSVSIPIHPHGWMRLCACGNAGCPSPGFNPHPPSRMDATARGGAGLVRTTSFNPHPPSRMDATPCAGVALRHARAVSIPIHPHGWMRRPTGRYPGNARQCFNPHPPSRMDATSADCDAPGQGQVSIPIHPHGWMRLCACGNAGCPSPGFNPHPPSRMDATRELRCLPHVPLVSIPIHPHGWMRQVLEERRPDVDHVSIPIHPHGWMRRALRAPLRALSRQFQSPSTLQGQEAHPFSPIGSILAGPFGAKGPILLRIISRGPACQAPLGTIWPPRPSSIARTSANSALTSGSRVTPLVACQGQSPASCP